AELGLLEFDEITNPYFVAKSVSESQMSVRPDRNIFTESAIDDDASLENDRTRADLRIGDAAEGMNRDIVSNHALAIDLNRWVDHRVGADLRIRVDVCRLGIDDRDAFDHQGF